MTYGQAILAVLLLVLVIVIGASVVKTFDSGRAHVAGAKMVSLTARNQQIQALINE